MLQFPDQDTLRPLMRGLCAILVVGGFVAACFVEIEADAFTALTSVASGIIGFYFGEKSGRDKANGES